MNKQVLIIAYYFPPLGMGGVQRVSKLAKYLPRFGYAVDVVTVKPIRYPACDATLLEELPDDVIIHRAGSTDPARVAQLLKLPLMSGTNLSGKIKKSGRYWPDSKIGWKKRAVALAERIIKKKDIDIIFSTSPPMTAHLIAMEIAEKHNIKWVADFRDFWESVPPEDIFSNNDMIKMSYDLLGQIHKRADAITRVNDAIGANISKKPISVQGGYDPDDFEMMKHKADGDKFLITYLGSSGLFCPLDRIIEAIGRAAVINSEFGRDVRVKIIGQCDATALEKSVDASKLGNRVIFTGYLSHRLALEEAEAGDLSLLSLAREYPGILPGKVFDLLPLGAPVLAVVPEPGEAAKIIEQSRAGVCVDPNDVDKISEKIIYFFDQFKQGIKWKKNDISHFSRIEVARKFGEIFDRLTEGEQRSDA